LSVMTDALTSESLPLVRLSFLLRSFIIITNNLDIYRPWTLELFVQACLVLFPFLDPPQLIALVDGLGLRTHENIASITVASRYLILATSVYY